jgi:hypothetical protein
MVLVLSVSDQCLYLLARVVKSEDYDSFIRSFAHKMTVCALSSSCMCVSLVPCMLMPYAIQLTKSDHHWSLFSCLSHLKLWTIRLRFSNWIFFLFRDFTHGHANFKLHTHRQRNNGTLLLMMYIVHFMHCTVLALALFIKVGVR